MSESFPSFRLVKSDVLPLTPILAAEFRDMTPSPTERDLDPHRLRYLREKADAGKLVSFHWASARLGEQEYRVNGQTSSAMLCERDGAFPLNLTVHRDYYEVNSAEGLADLFRQFDDRRSSRSAGDVAGAYQNLYTALHEVKKAVGKLGVEAIVWYRKEVVGAPVPTGDNRYALFNEADLQQFLIWLNTILTSKTKELQPLAVIAAMYVTFQVNEAEARKFWDLVARGGRDYVENDPMTVLDAWLRNFVENKKIDKPRPAKFYQACLYAWNAYREEKPITAIKVDTKKAWLTPLAA